MDPKKKKEKEKDKPLQFVAMVGRPIDMASICGLPQPSPREGSTNASAP